MSQAEKAIYGATTVDGFFNLCCVYIPRYRENIFAAKNAFKGAFGSSHVPDGKNAVEGMQRVLLFKTFRDYATLRDRNLSREEALAVLAQPSKEDLSDAE